MDTGNMPTTIDPNVEFVRVLGRLGVGLLELITSIRDEFVVLDRERRVIATLGDWPDESRRRLGGDMVGMTLREAFGPEAFAVHEGPFKRALQGEHVSYEWTGRRGRQPVRLSTAAFPLQDSSSNTVGIVLITRNITPVKLDHKRADVSAKRLQELEQGIQQLAGTIENYHKTQREFDADSPLHQLSSRERQVLELLGRGYRPRSIAEELHVSPETVRNHLKAMFKKTGTHSQEGLIAIRRAFV